ncbi:MAG TPA: MoaD/ThiS family protein [Gemmata sp.]|jgi:sulfur carrier protein ThiS|nr:MoaD/ThiS family protein [Gemmata sp.]
MPRIILTAHLSSQAGAGDFEVSGSTVRELLEALFVLRPGLRGYLLDDQGVLRHHVAAFVDGEVVTDKVTLTTSVPTGGELYLVQALSGG